jgi:Ni2+-binding GTPase involved in maturation of urease and hydrogenase
LAPAQGFLGSGKTTLLNYILKENHGMKIAVVENGRIASYQWAMQSIQQNPISQQHSAVRCPLSTAAELNKPLVLVSSSRLAFAPQSSARSESTTRSSKRTMP